MSDAKAAYDVGSLGEEAVKLLSAMSTWAQEHTAGDPGESADGHGCTCARPVACSWCPICQAVSAVREANPELKEQLVTSGLALTAAARAFLETFAAPTRSSAFPDVQHIDLSDDGGDRPWE